MPPQLRHAFARRALPEDFAAAFVEAVNAPVVLRAVLGGRAGAVQAGLELGIRVVADTPAEPIGGGCWVHAWFIVAAGFSLRPASWRQSPTSVRSRTF